MTVSILYVPLFVIHVNMSYICSYVILILAVQTFPSTVYGVMSFFILDSERLLIPKDKLNPLTFDNYYTVSYALSPEDNRTAYQSFLVYSMMVSVDGAGSDPRQSCAVVLVDDGEVTGISALIKPRSVALYSAYSETSLIRHSTGLEEVLN